MSDMLSPTPTDDKPFDLKREPLDRPPPVARDWGGDGTDLSRPVRAHVLAALRPNTAPYPPPVDGLRALGDSRKAGVEERRHALGLAQEHLPDLIRMARDRGLYTADGDTDEVGAPLHAVAALGDLDVSTAVSELIPLFDLDHDDREGVQLRVRGSDGAEYEVLADQLSAEDAGSANAIVLDDYRMRSSQRRCVKGGCCMSDPAYLARGWFRKGDSDLSTARLVAAGAGPYDTACFHAQQAAEKYLK